MGRSQGVAAYNMDEALAWGTTGAGLRATGLDFDVRKWRPYSGYENFDFEVPVGAGISDAHPRAAEDGRDVAVAAYPEQCLKTCRKGRLRPIIR